MNETLVLVTLLFTKHLIVDFFLQNRYQWSNKGTYGHPGGILHAALHGAATALCFLWVAPAMCLVLALIDMLVHYHVDWAKVNLNRKLGWGPSTHPEFWYLMGFDQWLHAMTYVVLIAMV